MALGVAPPAKPSPSDSTKTIYAFSKTDEGMKALAESDNERVAMLAAARLGQKSTIGETRAQRLIGMAERGALPVYLKYYGAHTGRWSGGDKMNWQNFPRGGEIRLSIMAPAGQRLCVVDLAQIEFRMEMWLAGQADELAALRAGEDVYCNAAAAFYGRPVTKENKIERQTFKTVLLGCGYGMGAEKFASVLAQQNLEGDAKALVGHYRKSHPEVVRLWRYADKVMDSLFAGNEDFAWGPMQVRGQRIYLPSGAWIDYSHLTRDGDGYAITTRYGAGRIYGAKLVENVVRAHLAGWCYRKPCSNSAPRRCRGARSC